MLKLGIVSRLLAQTHSGVKLGIFPHGVATIRFERRHIGVDILILSHEISVPGGSLLHDEPRECLPHLAKDVVFCAGYRRREQSF